MDQQLLRRTWTGLEVKPLNQLQLGAIIPLCVQAVAEGGPAHHLGILPNDILLALNKRPIRDKRDFLALERLPIGSKVILGVTRKEKPFETTLELQQLPLERDAEFETLYSSAEGRESCLRVITTWPRNCTQETPIIVFLQGIEVTSVDIPTKKCHPYRQIIAELTKSGYVTLRIERSGVGDSLGAFIGDLSFNDEFCDYLLVLREIITSNQFQKRAIYLFGYSLGSIHAALLSKNIDVAGIITFGGVYRSFREHILATSRRQTILRKDSTALMNSTLETTHEFWDLVEGTDFTPRQMLENNPAFTIYLSPDGRLRDRNLRFYRELLRLDLTSVWNGGSGDCLIVGGRGDFVAGFKDQMRLFSGIRRYERGRNSIFLPADTDHRFRKVKTMKDSYENHVEADFDYDAIRNIVTWIRSHQTSSSRHTAKR